jgi:2-oxoglutarate ferredoxin oxidoreductase subunit gamma
MSQAGAIDLRELETVQLRLGGFGGQGIILAGNIIGRAATVFIGRNAVLTQSYGPESRGGACMAEVVIADGDIDYPRVLEPDVAVMMSQEAYTKYGVNRPENCLLIVDDDLVELDEEKEKDRQVLRAPATRLAEGLGRRIISNIVMLGFICAATNFVDVQVMRDAVESSVPPGTEELNLKGVDVGYESGRKLLDGTEGGSLE